MQNLDKTMIDKLIGTAIEQLKFSYAPYSNFKVGAALLAKNGEIYTGCNIENAAYTPTNCAERTAFFKAVSEGIKEFDAICIVGGKGGVLTEYAAPCGVCRQVMMEFCNPETFKIVLAVDKEHYDIYTLKELQLIFYIFPDSDPEAHKYHKHSPVIYPFLPHLYLLHLSLHIFLHLTALQADI